MFSPIRCCFINALLLMFACLSCLAKSQTANKTLTFALVPKSVNNPFFLPARDGCKDQASVLGFECLYAGPQGSDPDGSQQAEILTQLIQNNRSGGVIDGLAISVSNLTKIVPIINQAVELGLPVITFDSDAPASNRMAYIGTDNRFFGKQIAKLLKQLEPHGGTFAVVSSTAGPNIKERENGFREEILSDTTADDDPKGRLWTELITSPSDSSTIVDLAVDQMEAFAQQDPTAIIPLMGAPMRSSAWIDFVNRNRHRNMTVISGDAMPNQLSYLDRRYVHGLVGQLPYEMGWTSMQVLHDLLVQLRDLEQHQSQSTTTKQDRNIDVTVVGTNVVTHILVPLELPLHLVDHNLVGDLVYTGYILFGLLTVTGVAMGTWTLAYKSHRVVLAAQPVFLIMVAGGVVLMGSSLVPLSFDDNGDSESNRTWICMSVPWLGFTGFTTVFVALFGKTLRVNRIFHSKAPHERIKVTERDVIFPGLLLLSLNVIVLTCWSVFDPLTYVRDNLVGTDGWNRVISTYGACRSESVWKFLAPLAIINLSVLVLANWQAYKARSIESEFSESKYIAIANGFLLQACLSGIPISFVVRKIPQAFYLIVVFMIFVTCMAVLLLIFVPKIVLKSEYCRKGAESQRRLIRTSIQESQRSVLRQLTASGDSSNNVTDVNSSHSNSIGSTISGKRLSRRGQCQVLSGSRASALDFHSSGNVDVTLEEEASIQFVTRDMYGSSGEWSLTNIIEEGRCGMDTITGGPLEKIESCEETPDAVIQSTWSDVTA